jgi:hypothetical protein
VAENTELKKLIEEKFPGPNSVYQFGDACQVTAAQLYNIIGRRSLPGFTMMERMAVALGVDFNRLRDILSSPDGEN